MILFRVLVAVVSIFIGVWFLYLAFKGRRKIRLVWLLPACLWFFSCLTLVLNPEPPSDISDVGQWQGSLFLAEVAVRVGIGVLSLLVFVSYRLSSEKEYPEIKGAG